MSKTKKRIDPTSHTALSDFLNMQTIKPTIQQNDIMREQARLVVSVIRHISYESNLSVQTVYNMLKATGSIKYLIEHWSILHTFDINKVIDLTKQFHNNKIGQ